MSNLHNLMQFGETQPQTVEMRETTTDANLYTQLGLYDFGINAGPAYNASLSRTKAKYPRKRMVVKL